MTSISSKLSGSDLAQHIGRKCLLTRIRRISRLLTSIYDQTLRPFGINSPQFTLLVLIGRKGPMSRAEISRENHQERSTLTRNLQILLSEGWIEEVADLVQGRSRPVALTESGRGLLQQAAPAWHKAQERARKLLGAPGAEAILEIAERIET